MKSKPGRFDWHEAASEFLAAENAHGAGYLFGMSFGSSR
jgi:hypothetical protein